MSDILLSHGYFLGEDEKERQIMKPYPPLGLLYLSAYLKAVGYGVEIYDSTFGRRSELIEKLRVSAGGLLGIYTNLITRPSVLEIIRAAKQSGWTVILGGPESANYPAEYLSSGADVIVIGEGEATLAELISALSRPEPRLEEIRGIVFANAGGEIVHTPPRPQLADLDRLPLPDREAIDHAKYLQVWREHHGASSINLITARGCPYRCTWCSHAVYGYSHRRRSPANVADEVAWIVDRYRPDQLWYADDVFTISHPWMEQYGAELRRRGLPRLPFETITRADRLQSATAAQSLRDLGCYRVWIGSESGSQRILDAMQRGVTVEQVRRAVRLAQDCGMQVGMFLMWGYEGEQIEDIAATVEHVVQTNPEVFFTTLAYPIKGTPYFDAVRRKVELPIEWAAASDRDYIIRGRRERDYYRLADAWLRSAVEAHRIGDSDPGRAAELHATARRAREEMSRTA